MFFCLPASHAQNAGDFSFPVIKRMDPSDTGFKQYISDVENNRRRLISLRSRPLETAEHLTIYQYTPRDDEDIFSLAARCNLPYSSLASLNKLNNPLALETGKSILLPSCPGIYIPANIESELQKLIGAARLSSQESVEIKISLAGKTETFYFFPGADFSPSERAFFLNSGFHFPLRFFRLTSEYGIRANPVTGSVVMHQGLDLAAPEGTEVFAAADGIVTYTGFDPVYGNYIVISHSERWTSLYGHLQKIETVLRSTVKSGSLIGRVGSTGQSTGPHLHFELRQDGKPLNPAGRLRQ
ncbi:MAG: M23 family metallopeptidase [Treponema sp.]|nr:M23 family metallopeptidase [Treponema sp.]